MAVRNQLPEGVGKKIVEALKRQAEADISPIVDIEKTTSNDNLAEIKKDDDIKFEIPQEQPPIEDFIVEDSQSDIISEQVFEETKPQEKEVVDNEIPLEPKPVMTFDFSEQTVVKKDKVQKPAPNVSVNIPSNVAILKNLIATLPAGVSKQTGAQIIRQTLEAMGLPMNSVLKEAQEVQEELNTSVREFMLKIQEYKTNILRLQESVEEYQKNVSQLNDLVSLFLLTDKK